eukprot:882570-Pleurochrysis_carterae.AAC.1
MHILRIDDENATKRLAKNCCKRIAKCSGLTCCNFINPNLQWQHQAMKAILCEKHGRSNTCSH